MTQVELAAALRSIPGVEDAEVGNEGAEHEGVRVRLTSDADPNAVAEAVRAMLADRGLRSRMAPPRVRVEPTSAPPPPFPRDRHAEDAPSSVSDLFGDSLSEDSLAEDSLAEEKDERGSEIGDVVRAGDSRVSDATGLHEDAPIGPDIAGPGSIGRADVDMPEPLEAPADPNQRFSPDRPEPIQRSREPEPASDLATSLAADRGSDTVDVQTAQTMGGIASLRLEEDRHGVTITAVAKDGTTAVRKARPHEDAIRNGVIATVSALFDPRAPAPFVVAIRESVIEGGEIVTIVLDDHTGERLVGAAVVGAEPAFAIARATFAAMSDR
ncbi:MAG: hypothetical protein KJN81_07750 [Acidimicrobiia bacterium]|nr:hypothetical protein [Acidimicrobiia bacterium]NNL28305.1 hypothetical protein [Acidimicrobiia bacterium]